MSVEKLVRSRLARIALACGLIAIGTWEFLPYLTHRVASSAFVNAEIVRVTAPIRGRLSAEIPGKGAYIEDDAAITLVEAPVADRRQIAIFEQQFAVATAQIALAQRHLSEIEETDRRLLDRAEQHRAAILSEMAAEIDEAKAEALACTIERDELARDLNLRRQLRQSGVASVRTLEAAESAHSAASAECEAAAARLGRLTAEMRAAEKGVYLRDGGNDTPYSQQQRDRLMLRRQEVEAQLLSETARVEQLEGEIAKERDRILDTTRYDFTLPKEHLVWAISASPGSTVVEGQSLIDLADCTRRFVSVDLPERQAETIRRGDVAQIRLLGSEAWITGVVERMRGSAALTDERLYAAQPTAPSERQVSVDVLLAGATPEDSSRQCDIGRQAEVRFDRALPGMFALIGSAFAGEPAAEAAK
jgi:multidrug resistance efflux pump